MIDVSIIIVNWNTKEILLNSLESVFKYSQNVCLEVIVVDNASSDGSVEAVVDKFPQVKLIVNDENLGFARANNIGIRQSAGRFICLINSDIIVLDKCIERLVQYMERHHNIGMIGPQIVYPDNTLQYSCRRYPSVWNQLCEALLLYRVFPHRPFFAGTFMEYWPHDSIRKVDVLSGCFWLVRRESLEEVGLLDEDFFIYGEDIDWCKRFVMKGWEIVFYPDSKAIHYRGMSSAKMPIKFYLEMQKANLFYWYKHHGCLGRACYTGVVLLHHLLRVIPRAIQSSVCSVNKAEYNFKFKRSLACILWILGLIEIDTKYPE